MIKRFKTPLEFLQKNKILSLLSFTESNNNIENDPNFVIYNTAEFLPIAENKRHFASLASILSVENGYFGTRSCLEECYCEISTGAMYIAGIYMVNDDLTTDKLAVMPDWTRMFMFIDEEPVDLFSCEAIEHNRGFDIKRGVSTRDIRLKDSQGRVTRLRTEKFASLKDKHLGGQRVSVIPENYSGKITIRVGIDGSVVNVDDADFERKAGTDFISLSVNLPEKKFKDGEINGAKKVCISGKTSVHSGSREYKEKNTIAQRFTGYDERYAFEEYDINAEKAKEIRIDRIVSIYTSLDSENPSQDSYEKLKAGSYESAHNDHCKIMEKRLNDSAIAIEGDKIAQRYANYSIARLVMAGEKNGETSSIAARTLTGPSYAGHVFWDNEIFDLPFFIYTNPEAARNMLMYRYNTLEGARENRRVENERYNTFYKGARFAWESTSSGVERTPLFVINENGKKIRIFTGTNEKHITPDLAYAIHKYWQISKDSEFLRKYGAEIIFETARYSASILSEEDDGKLHLKNVIGPDEYHEELAINPLNGLKEGVNDNAYTNILIQHNLEVAVKIAEYLEKNFSDDYETLKTKLDLKDNEIKHWRQCSKRIYVNQDKKTGVIEQFEGFNKLKEVDLDYFRKKYGEVNAQKFDQVLEHEYRHNKEIDPDRNNYKVLKQPDVLMFMALLPEKYSYEVQKANYHEYEPKTSHGSSLSAGIHSLIAARLGYMGDAYKYYLDTGGMDIDNVMGNAANGIHAASLGATWQALVMGFGGMQLREDCLVFNPNLPQIWNKLEFGIKWQGQDIKFSAKRKSSGEETLLIKVWGDANKKIPVKVGENIIKELIPSMAYSAVRTPEGWKWDYERENKVSLITELAAAISDKFKTTFSD